MSVINKIGHCSKMHNGFVLVSFLKHNSGAKFEEHRSNISREILDSVLYLFLGGGTINRASDRMRWCGSA